MSFRLIKKHILNITIAMVSLLVTFVILETGIRYIYKTFPFKYRIENSSGFVLDRDLGYRVKNVKGYNSLGLKNAEIPEKGSRFRILFLGDSLVEGFDTSLIEDQLKKVYPNIETEIINAGMVGYTTRQELDFLAMHGLGLKPDLVILGFVLNDLYEYLHRPKPGGLSIGADPSAKRSWIPKNNIFYRSYLAQAVVQRAGAIKRILRKHVLKRSFYDFELMGGFHAAWKDFMWEYEEERICRMNRMLKADNIPFMIICFPVVEQMDEKKVIADRPFLLKPQSKLADICKRLDIPLFDLWKDLFVHRDKKYFTDYLHINNQGYELVASKLAEFIRENRLIAQDPAW